MTRLDYPKASRSPITKTRWSRPDRRGTMRQNRDDQRSADADLHFYFSADRLFWRSPMGPMLEHARAERFTSDGRPVGQPREWDWLPPDHTGKQQPAHRHIEGHKGGEGVGYEPCSEDILRHGSVSRRIMALSRSNPRHFEVLAAYYSDRGSRWAAASQDRFDGNGRLLSKGVGPGALVAIYPLTPSGRALILHERSISSKRVPRIVSPPSAVASAAASHDVTRAAIEAEIADIRQRLSAMSVTIQSAELARSTVLAEMARTKEARKPVITTLRDRAARAERDVAVARSEESELQRINSLLRRTLANSAVPSGLPAPELPPVETRRVWREEYTAYMTPFEKSQAQYKVDCLRRQQALAERSSVLKRLSKEGLAIAPNDPRLPAVPPEPERPAPPQGMTAPTAPQARLPSLHLNQRTSEVSDLSDDDVIEVAFLLDRKTKGPSRRRAFLERARAEASSLFIRASADWLAISKRQKKPSTLPPDGSSRKDASDQTGRSQNEARSPANKPTGYGRSNASANGSKVVTSGYEGVVEEGPISETRLINASAKVVAA